MIVITTALIGLLYTIGRAGARRDTRKLLVRCEEALGFYQDGLLIPGRTLYDPAWLQYSKKGHWLNWAYLLVPCVGVGFLIVLWTH